MVTLKTMDMSIVRPADKHRFFPSKNDKSIQHMNLAIDCDYFNYFVSFVAPNLKEKIDSASDYILIHLSEEQFNYLNHLKKLINTIPTDSVYQKKTSLNLIFFTILKPYKAPKNRHLGRFFLVFGYFLRQKRKKSKELSP